MIARCSNCAGRLVFDPGTQRLVCDKCGSRFKPEEFNVSDKDPVWDKRPYSMNEILGTDSEEYMDCYVYTCSSCGGEIVINGKEASTQCIYCGNPSVIFSRIARRKKPAYILPFKNTREDALDNIKAKLKKGIFVPKLLKNFTADDVRGIYIPYWIVNCEHHGTVVVENTAYFGKSETSYHGRAGKMKIVNLPVEASRMLDNNSSLRLEPYGLQALKPFDEDYLLGFYSDIPDITYGELKNVVHKRATTLFDEAVIDSTSGKIYDERHSTAIDYQSRKCIMLPAWFITYEYKGKRNTILVNGQTGKVVGGIPWNKKMFYSLLFATGLLLSVFNYFFLTGFGTALVNLVWGNPFMTMFLMLTGIVSMFSFGIATISKASRSLELTQSGSIFNFVKKRQG